MSAFSDARTIPAGTVLQTDVAIIGGGPAGITLALGLAEKNIRVLILESGGTDFDGKTQQLYAGSETGAAYLPLNACRQRYLGGSSNHWGGWCRPLDKSDFEKRSWVKHSGWPIALSDIEPYFPRAQAFVEAGQFLYAGDPSWFDKYGAPLNLGDGGVFTSWFQFSKTRDSDLPTYFGHRYGDDLMRDPRVTTLLHANVTRIGLTTDANSVDHLDVATLTGRKFKVKAKQFVLATGGIENARLLLASNDVMKTGIGNGNDLVGRFFADHPIPRDTATMVIFSGKLAPYYLDNMHGGTTNFRATFAPTEKFKRERGVLGSLATVEHSVTLDDLGKAAVDVTASALGVDASEARAFSLGCGMEIEPDPDRRFTLSGERDALGMPRLKLHMTLPDADLARYRMTVKELGRQLLASRIGMIHLDRTTRQSWLEVMDWGNHHMGTTRMSADPKTGVVDADLKVYGVANLFVAGSSVFPTYGASNPTMNLIALTLRMAERMKRLFP